MSAPSQGTKISRTAHPALPQPLSVLSPNMSKMQRNHTVNAAIQMKNQKLHSRTSPKSVVIASIVESFARVSCLTQSIEDMRSLAALRARGPVTRLQAPRLAVGMRGLSRLLQVGIHRPTEDLQRRQHPGLAVDPACCHNLATLVPPRFRCPCRGEDQLVGVLTIGDQFRATRLPLSQKCGWRRV